MIQAGKEVLRDQIVHSVLTARRISKRDLLSTCRDEDLVLARKDIACSLKRAGFGVRHIGRILNRDRATVEHYLGLRLSTRAALPNSINRFPEDVRDIVSAIAQSEGTTPAEIVTQWITERARMELGQQRSAA
jgi:hypothetical protein